MTADTDTADTDTADTADTDTADTDTADTADTDSQDPLRIAIVASLSGNLAALGTAQARGAQAAVEYINSQGGIDGRPIEVVTEDDQTDPAVATRASTRLLAESDCLVGPTLSAAGSAVAPLAIENETLHMAMSVLGPEVIDAGADYSFGFPIDQMGEAVAANDYVSEEGITRVGLMYAGNPSGVEWLDSAEEIGMPLVAVEEWDPTGTDFTANLVRLLDSDPELVITVGGGTQIGVIMKNLYELGYEGQILGAQGLSTLPVPVLLDLAGPDALTNARGLFAAPVVADSLPASDPRLPHIEQFLETFSEVHGEAPGALVGFAGYGWDAVSLCAEASRIAGTTDGPAMLDAMHSIDGHVGVAATYEFSPEDHQGAGPDDQVLVRYDPTTESWVVLGS